MLKIFKKTYNVQLNKVRNCAVEIYPVRTPIKSRRHKGKTKRMTDVFEVGLK